jgi:hypothetical protein
LRLAGDGGFAEAFQNEMRGEINDEREGGEHESEPRGGGHPCLRRGVVETPNVVDVDRRLRIGKDGAGGGEEEVSDEHQRPGDERPTGESAAIVAEARDHEEEHERKPAVKEGEAAQKERARGVEHVIRHADGAHADEVRGEVHAPDGLDGDDADGGHAGEEGVLEPDCGEREEEGDVAEVEEIGGAVLLPVNRHEDSHKGSVADFEPEREASGSFGGGRSGAALGNFADGLHKLRRLVVGHVHLTAAYIRLDGEGALIDKPTGDID